MSMIQAKGLYQVLRQLRCHPDVNFSVNEGEIVGLLGPNAAGKTTTMRIITGYMPPSDGVADRGRIRRFHQSSEAWRLIGHMPETVPLHTDLTVHQYLDFVAEIKGVANRDVVDRLVSPSLAGTLQPVVRASGDAGRASIR